MGFFDGDTWVVPETFSFICRICEILAMSCILMPASEAGGRSFSELVFVLSCAVVFFLNCFEFIGTPNENLMVQLLALTVGLTGIGLLLANADPNPPHDQSYKSAFYASAFAGMSMFSCFISGTDFYIYSET